MLGYNVCLKPRLPALDLKLLWLRWRGILRISKHTKIFCPDEEANDYWWELTFLNSDIRNGYSELDVYK